MGPQRGRGAAGDVALLLAKLLASSAHQSQMKNTETEFGGNRKVAFSASREGTCRLVLQELGPSHEESRGVHEGLQSGVGDEEQR